MLQESTLASRNKICVRHAHWEAPFQYRCKLRCQSLALRCWIFQRPALKLQCTLFSLGLELHAVPPPKIKFANGMVRCMKLMHWICRGLEAAQSIEAKQGFSTNCAITMDPGLSPLKLAICHSWPLHINYRCEAKINLFSLICLDIQVSATNDAMCLLFCRVLWA